MVYRDGVLAADRRGYSGSKHPIGTKTKIHRLADGSLFGCSTPTPGLAEKLRRWVDENGVEKPTPATIEAQAIVVRSDGAIFYFKDGDSFSGPLEAEYMAIGSGSEYALGALTMGADAAHAVEVAIACDVWSGGGVETLRLTRA
ncbi:peptidase S14 [Xanthobacter tagetidis]|uniref:peptidase S14 n=1 Tax=Xanthobacter tagetidis TaxID=60216 RepID=UPI0011C3B7F3|nr:peptidase S14 [Xanthobacter tagetidis]MBB6306223.1 20S proteasome alpha/beta subunit [Xanthobacter tagetidis]